LNEYRVQKEIRLNEGKYGFRMKNPSKYFDNGVLILNVNPSENENESHFDWIMPIVEGATEEDEGLEMFITKEFEKKALKFVKTTKMTQLKAYELYRSII
jgi:hypothetical protein